jgi:hypothetical protein
MAERTPAFDSEKVEEIAPDKAREIKAILSAGTPDACHTGDGGEINRRVKRNIITVPTSLRRTEKRGSGRWDARVLLINISRCLFLSSLSLFSFSFFFFLPTPPSAGSLIVLIDGIE